MTIEEMLDRETIRMLSGNYMRGLDRLDTGLLRSVFFDDALLDYGFYRGGPDPFVDMCHNALRDHLANHHMIGQINIELEGDVAFGEVYFQAFHRLVADSGERDLMIAGRYVDRYERRDGVWKIAFRSEINDWSTDAAASDTYFKRQTDSLRGKRKPEDGLYRLKEATGFVP